MKRNDLPACMGGEKTCDILSRWPRLDRKDIKQMAKLLKSGKIAKSNGVYNERLEKETARRNGRKYAITINNATVGLELALRGLGIGAGDEVIVPAYTFYSSVSSIVAVGAIPVICDIDKDTMLLSDGFVNCITDKTKAVMAVDWGGLTAEIPRLRHLIGERNIKIVVDSAQSFGSIGAEGSDYGDVSVYSFQKSKNLTCGEGGAIATDDEKLYQYIYSLHNCGRAENSKWYEHRYNGTNARLSELCACLAVSQLEQFDKQAELRQHNAEYFISELKDSKIFRILQTKKTDRRRVYHYLPVQCDTQYGTAEDYVRFLRSEGVPVIPSYEKTCDMQEAFLSSNGRCGEEISVAHSLCGSVILFPHELLLVGEKNAALIVTAFKKIEKYILATKEETNG